MPGGVPVTSTLALTNATLPYVLQLATKGYRDALKQSPTLLNGLNIIAGKVTHGKVAEAFGMPYHPAESLLE
jgi:alanine dehydrogenase